MVALRILAAVLAVASANRADSVQTDEQSATYQRSLRQALHASDGTTDLQQRLDGLHQSCSQACAGSDTCATVCQNCLLKEGAKDLQASKSCALRTKQALTKEAVAEGTSSAARRAAAAVAVRRPVTHTLHGFGSTHLVHEQTQQASRKNLGVQSKATARAVAKHMAARRKSAEDPVKAAGADVEAAAKDAAKTVGEAAQTAGKAVSEAAAAAGKQVEAATKAAGKAVEEAAKDGKAAAEAAGKEAAKGVEAAAQDAAKGVKDAAKHAGKTVEEAAKDAGKTVKDAAKDAGKDVAKAAGAAADAAKDAAKDAGKSVEKATAKAAEKHGAKMQAHGTACGAAWVLAALAPVLLQ